MGFLRLPKAIFLSIVLTVLTTSLYAQYSYPKKDKKVSKYLQGTWVFSREASIEANKECNFCTEEKINEEIPTGGTISITFEKEKVKVVENRLNRQPKESSGTWTRTWKALNEEEKEMTVDYPCLQSLDKALFLLLSSPDQRGTGRDLVILHLSKDRFIFGEKCFWVMKKQ